MKSDVINGINKKLAVVAFASIFLFGLFMNDVYAHDDEEFAQAEDLLKQKISCDDLSKEQLEIIGDYYMEQMHPGELHEIMDERMGGEGSLSLRQVHINIARMFYCGEREAVSMGMMDMMVGRGSYGMMGMMQGAGYPSSYYRESNYLSWFFNWILLLFVIVILVLLIVFLIRSLGHKDYRTANGKKNKISR